MLRWYVIPLSFCLVLAGCGENSLRSLRSVELPSDPYYRELARLYLTLAEEQEMAYDWESSEYFANKGLEASYGHDVPRANPADWDIPPAEQGDIGRANELFDQLITPATRQKTPLFAAQAQVYFDCWLEEAEESWKKSPRERTCKEAFFDALGAVQQFDYYYKKDPSLKNLLPKELAPVISTSYLVFFGWNQVSLDDEAMKIVNTVVRDFKEHGKAEVVLNGHADGSGTEEQNLVVSESRAETVKMALIEAGIPAKLIKIFAFGESDPKVKTTDGAKEKTNRRVEVFLD